MKHSVLLYAALTTSLVSPLLLADAADRVERRFDQCGERIERSLERKGDRVERRLERKGERLHARLDRRN